MEYWHLSRNLCAKEWVEQHHGMVDEFATYFLALPTEELEVRYSKNLTIYACLNSHFCVAFQGPFQVPFEWESCLIDWIRDLRCTLHLDRFAVIYLHVPLLHLNPSKCDVCSYFVCFKYNLSYTSASQQTISNDLLHTYFTSSYFERFAHNCCPSWALHERL